MDARAVAVELLLRQSDSSRVPLDNLASDPSFAQLDGRDRRFVTELVFGVLRNLVLLDHYIEWGSHKPLRKLDPEIVSILRTALYQLNYLRVPERAAVHSAVELCKGFKKSSASPFVNALLRRFLSNPPDLRQEQTPEALALRYSHPLWLVERYLERYGGTVTEDLLRANNQPPVPFLRVNSAKIGFQEFCQELEREQISFRPYPKVPNCLIVESPSFPEHPLYLEGYCFFMDGASQEVVYLGNIQKARRIGDFCSAPGGKLFVLNSCKAPDATIYSCDISHSRLRQVVERARLYEIPTPEVVTADLTRGCPFQIPFDFILLDVPCSGTGTLRSNPDIRLRALESDLKRFHSKQLSILKNSFECLRRGGDLLYITCSTEPEENEDVIEEFLADQPGAGAIADFYRSFPGDSGAGGFFAAQIRRL